MVCKGAADHMAENGKVLANAYLIKSYAPVKKFVSRTLDRLIKNMFGAAKNMRERVSNCRYVLRTSLKEVVYKIRR